MDVQWRPIISNAGLSMGDPLEAAGWWLFDLQNHHARPKVPVAEVASEGPKS